jgi:hypothetical protein
MSRKKGRTSIVEIIGKDLSGYEIRQAETLEIILPGKQPIPPLRLFTSQGGELVWSTDTTVIDDIERGFGYKTPLPRLKRLLLVNVRENYGFPVDCPRDDLGHAVPILTREAYNDLTAADKKTLFHFR